MLHFLKQKNHEANNMQNPIVEKQIKMFASLGTACSFHALLAKNSNI